VGRDTRTEGDGGRKQEPEREPEPELAAGLHGRPTAEPGLTYHFLRGLQRFLAACVRIRFIGEGLEHLPRTADGRRAGGWIAAVMPHRTWIDPFVPWVLLPPRPRFAFFGDARTMARSPIRRWILARLGGVIPIPASRDPKVVETHLAAARDVLVAGAVFMLMPETGPPSKLGELRRLGSGTGYVALRNRAPIVPVILGGNEELHFSRRILLRVLPALDPYELAGLDPAGPSPEPGSSAERVAVRRLTQGLAAAAAPAVAEVHEQALARQPRRPRGRFLTTFFR